MIKKYLSDYSNTACVYSSQGDICLQEEFNKRNLKDKVLEEFTYKNDVLISAKGYRYDMEGNNVVLKEIFVNNKSLGDFLPSSNGFEFLGNYESRITFDKYDANGNLLQQTLKDDTPVSYIWGYDNNYPIVNGVNIEYDALLKAHNESKGADYDNKIRRHLLTNNSLINTHQYNPLVGIVKETNARGIAKNYEYDPLNRLKNIKDFNENVLNSFDYNYKEIEKEGGLEVTGVNFLKMSPSSNFTKKMDIKNTSNYDITVYSVSLPNYFSSVWENKSFLIKPGETFRFPVTFHAPSRSTSIDSELIISSNQLHGTTEYVPIKASVISDGVPNLIISDSNGVEKDCYLFDYSYQTKTLYLDNTKGTAPVYILNITATGEGNDVCVISSWEDAKMKLKTDSTGTTSSVWDYENSMIPAGSKISFTVFLKCPIGGRENNWDLVSDMRVNYSEYPTEGFFISKSKPFYLRYRTSQCPEDTGEEKNEEEEPSFIINGVTTANCNNGMSGTITINSGSVKVLNESNSIAGPSGYGATISISGVRDLRPNDFVIINPTTYPKTYEFSSNKYECNGGPGRNDIKVSKHSLK